MINETETTKLPDMEFKMIVKRMVKELSENYNEHYGSHKELIGNYISIKKDIHRNY